MHSRSIAYSQPVPGGGSGRIGPLVVLSLMVATGACGSKTEGAKTSADTTTAVAAPDTTAAAGHDMAAMSMTGDADRDFLRMMSDHHKGLIAMAHETMEAARGTPESRADARKLDTKQDQELEQMVRLLEAQYQDPYEPKVMPADQAMVDSLLQESGRAYAAKFYQNVIAHHRRAVIMVDEYLPHAKRADVKAMAEQMKTAQLAEIEAFERKAAGQ